MKEVNNQDPTEETSPEEISAAIQEADTPSQEPAPNKEKELAEQIASLKDQLLRAMAETENTRRRAAKEKEDTAKFAVSNFAKEILSVADNFRRALDAIPKETTGEETLKHLITGVEATERQLLSSLGKFGIKQMTPMGKPFDPHYHRVMMEIEDASQPTGTVVQILQAGYMIQDRLLREALVAVSKGGAVIHKIDTEA